MIVPLHGHVLHGSPGQDLNSGKNEPPVHGQLLAAITVVFFVSRMRRAGAPGNGTEDSARIGDRTLPSGDRRAEFALVGSVIAQAGRSAG